jgi:hypothetical protein
MSSKSVISRRSFRRQISQDTSIIEGQFRSDPSSPEFVNQGVAVTLIRLFAAIRPEQISCATLQFPKKQEETQDIPERLGEGIQGVSYFTH